MAGLVLVIAGIQIFLVNRRFLPRPCARRSGAKSACWLCAGFYAFFAWFGLRDVLRGLLR